LNLCEAHILYIVLEPDAAFADIAEGEAILIPYEAVSVYDGEVSADDQQIVVNLEIDQLKGAPSFAEADLDLSVIDWENEVITYWSGIDVNLTLTSECRVASPNLGGQSQPAATPRATAQATTAAPNATPAAGDNMTVVNKIAYASDVLVAQVKDGNGKLLGQVEEVIVTPETGKLDFVAVRVDDTLMQGSQLVLVPLRALNLPEPGADQINLVLLVDTEILKNAPAINDLPDDFGEGWDNDAFDYWSQHVQMTREGE
jgi:sporulation protein YlmC with PRC-barrel domain